MSVLAAIPSPPQNGFHIGSLFFHVYGIAYVVAVAAAILITRWRWRKLGGDPELAYEIAMWAFPAGLVGGRVYFDITTPAKIPPHWWGVFAIWDGGLGIWGGIAFGVVVGLWVARRRLNHEQLLQLMDVVGPALLVSQGIGRVGNYFNQELFGAPSSLPWALKIAPQYRPPGYERFTTFEPTFLYEMIWDFGVFGFLYWLGSRGKVRAPGLFWLYVAGYSGFRIFEETQRIDYSNHFLGMRVNFWIALGLCLFALLVFGLIQRGFRGWGAPPALKSPPGTRYGPNPGRSVRGGAVAGAGAGAGGGSAAVVKMGTSGAGSAAGGAGAEGLGAKPRRPPPPPPRKRGRGGGKRR